MIEYDEVPRIGIAYVSIPAEILFNFKLSDKEKLLFGFLKCLAANKRGCWASNAYLGTLIGCSKDHMSKCISNLKNENYIKVSLTQKQDGSTERIITIDNNYLKKHHNLMVDMNEAIHSPPTVLKPTPLVFQNYPPSSTELPNNKTNKETIYMGEFVGCLPIRFQNNKSFMKSWAKWCIYKKEKNNPLNSKQHAKGFINKLRVYSEDTPEKATELINTAIENGWEGIWKPEENVKSSRTKGKPQSLVRWRSKESNIKLQEGEEL